MIEHFWVIVIVVLPFSIGAAVYMDKELHETSPDVLPYKWGYFNGWMGILVAFVYVLDFLLNAAYDHVLAGIFTLILGVLSAGFIFRNRWWTVISIIVQFNPLLWVINGIYLKNRWNEINDTSQANFNLLETFKKQPKAIRALIAICIFWVVVAFAYLFLFEPYGYRTKWGHFVKVLIFPPIVLVAGYFLYTKIIAESS